MKTLTWKQIQTLHAMTNYDVLCAAKEQGLDSIPSYKVLVLEPMTDDETGEIVTGETEWVSIDDHVFYDRYAALDLVDYYRAYGRQAILEETETPLYWSR